MKVIDYTIVEGTQICELADVVKSFIENGWQPFGEPLLSDHGSYQAIVKYEKEGE